ncbi:hypothetical protein D3C84_526970 [compost metagenome]
MADGDHRLAHLFQARQQHLIEDAAELGILIRRPLVKQHHLALLRQCQQQGDSLALPLGEIDVGDEALLDGKLAAHLQPLQPLGYQGLFRLRPQQVLEQVVVGEDGGEERQVGVAIGNGFTIQQDPARDRLIEPGQQHGQGRLAGAVAAYDEDLLPPLNGQIDGPHGEAALPLIVKAHLLQLDPLPGTGGRRQRERGLRLGQIQGRYLVERHLGRDQGRQGANALQQRSAQEQQGQGEGGGHIGVGPAEAVGQEEDQAYGPQHHDVRPVHRAQVIGIGADNLPAVIPGVLLIELVIDEVGTLAIERQLLAARDDGLVVLVEPVFGLAHPGQVAIDPVHQQPAHHHGHGDPEGGDTEQGGREQAEVDDGTQGEHQPLHQLRQAHEGDGDLADVAGEGGQQRPLPYLTNAGDVGVQQLLEQAAAQPVDEMMTEGGQGQLRAERDHQQQKDKTDKLTQDRQRIAD